MSAGSLAAAALEAVVGARHAVTELADGMSSSAWLAVVDGRELVVRVPQNDGARPLPRYRREVGLLEALAARDVPVAVPQVVVVDGLECAVAERLPGRPVGTNDWTDQLVGDAAGALRSLHDLPPELSVELDAVERFDLARIWPIDGTSLTGADPHALNDVRPDLVPVLEARRDEILHAAGQPATVVHTDLHPQHLLVDGGRLTGLLDVGDAFAGPPAWDLACMRYYHGPALSKRLLHAYGADEGLRRDAVALGAAFAAYKLAKTPTRVDVIERVLPMLTASG